MSDRAFMVLQYQASYNIYHFKTVVRQIWYHLLEYAISYDIMH